LHNLDLAIELTNLGYSVIACNNAQPLYAITPLVNNPIKSLETFKALSKSYNSLSILVDNYIALDVDSPEQLAELKSLSSRYNAKSNLVVKTKNGYHVYYAINYAVNAQNGSNNQIAIKCKCMPITAPKAYRADKQFTYKVVNNSLPSKQDLVLMPPDMYTEIRAFNRLEQDQEQRNNALASSEKLFVSPTATLAGGFRDKNNPPPRGASSCSDKPIGYYLSRLDVSRYLFGDLGSWLYILACCKLADPSSYMDALEWTRQGKYSNIEDAEFRMFWDYADAQKVGIMKPYAFLESRAKR
jgi:hypothetical protein